MAQTNCILSPSHPPVDPCVASIFGAIVNSALNRACMVGKSCFQLFGGIGQVCVSYFSRCCSKIPGKLNFKERRLILACGLRRGLAHRDGKYGRRTMAGGVAWIPWEHSQDGEVCRARLKNLQPYFFLRGSTS